MVLPQLGKRVRARERVLNAQDDVHGSAVGVYGQDGARRERHSYAQYAATPSGDQLREDALCASEPIPGVVHDASSFGESADAVGVHCLRAMDLRACGNIHEHAARRKRAKVDADASHEFLMQSVDLGLVAVCWIKDLEGPSC